jgi:ribosomal protein S18 acetylase RimI-like enzyme
VFALLGPGLVRAGLARLVSPRADAGKLGQLVDQYAQALQLEEGGPASGGGASGQGPRWLFGALEGGAGVRTGVGDARPVLGQVAMVVPSAGRTAGVYVSRDVEPLDLPRVFEGVGLSGAVRGERARQRAGVVGFARRWLIDRASGPGDGGPPIDLAQALIEPHHAELQEALLAGGFSPLAELAYMRAEVPRRAVPVPAWPSGVRVVALSEVGWPSGEGALLAAMARTYVGTLDCPALCDIRRPADVLASHVSVGRFDPSLWYLVLLEGEPHGCALVTRFADHDTAELVYLGLGPAVRGKGLARGMLEMVMGELSARGCSALACAVDTGNTPALKLYKDARFRRFARRLGFIADVRARPHGGGVGGVS